MVEESTSRDSNRPYPPASNVISVLERLRTRNIPDRVDGDYLRDAGISESLVHRVLFALRFLELVEDDRPTSALLAIATSTDEEYAGILAERIRSGYSDVFAVIDPSQDAEDRILNVFRRYTPASQRERMVRFFLGMCKEAGIPTLEATRQPTPSKTKSAKMRNASTSATKSRSNPQATGNESREAFGAEVPAALELLIRSLPPQGHGMDAGQRQRWLALAEAALAFVYKEPVNEPNISGAVDEVRTR